MIRKATLISKQNLQAVLHHCKSSEAHLIFFHLLFGKSETFSFWCTLPATRGWQACWWQSSWRSSFKRNFFTRRGKMDGIFIDWKFPADEFLLVLGTLCKKGLKNLQLPCQFFRKRIKLKFPEKWRFFSIDLCCCFGRWYVSTWSFCILGILFPDVCHELKRRHIHLWIWST